eukprot:6210794-Pleurochrysis_carterae.AAC.2
MKSSASERSTPCERMRLTSSASVASRKTERLSVRESSSCSSRAAQPACGAPRKWDSFVSCLQHREDERARSTVFKAKVRKCSTQRCHD